MTLSEEITHKLQSLQPKSILLEDESAHHAGHRGNSGGGHFKLTISSALFNNLSQIARHRMIYKTLDDLIPSKIHALSIHAKDDH